MPLARILTAFPERAESLAQQLREQGYAVEFLSPEKAGMLRADLEIDFEICDQKVVLRRAAELASKLNADIAVSPDALSANFASESDIYVGEHEIVEVPSHIPDAFVETFLAQGDRTGQIRNLEQAEHMVALPPDMLAAESPRVKAQDYQVPEIILNRLESTNQELMQAQTEQPLRTIDVPVVNTPGVNVTSIPDPERHGAGSFGFETQDQRLHQRSEVQAYQAIHTSRAEFLERAGALASSALAAVKQTSTTLAASARRLGTDCIAWINVRMAAAHDARQQRQMEAEKQREVARVRAEELEIARDAAALRLQELLRERGGLADQQPIPPATGPVPAFRLSEQQVAPQFKPAANATFFETLTIWFEGFKDIVLTRKYGQQWEAVLMGVAAACALFVVGVAVNSFRPRPALSTTITKPSLNQPGSNQNQASSLTPVSARATNPSAQPYSGVTVQAGKPGVTLLPAPVTSGPVQVTSNKPSPRESDVTVRHFGKLSPRRSDSDVTVRHFDTQPRPAAHNTNTSGVKRFSDLD